MRDPDTLKAQRKMDQILGEKWVPKNKAKRTGSWSEPAFGKTKADYPIGHLPVDIKRAAQNRMKKK